MNFKEEGDAYYKKAGGGGGTNNKDASLLAEPSVHLRLDLCFKYS